jgi:hypothetical protein
MENVQGFQGSHAEVETSPRLASNEEKFFMYDILMMLKYAIGNRKAVSSFINKGKTRRNLNK